MPIKKRMRGLPSDNLAEGFMFHDACLTTCQWKFTSRFRATMQLEQETYMSNHPEVAAMLELFISKMTQVSKRKGILKEACKFFTKPMKILDKDIREHIGVPKKDGILRDTPTIEEFLINLMRRHEAHLPPFNIEDADLINDLKNISVKHYPPEPWNIPTPYVSTPNTPSSSFLSIITSDTTLPTPELIRAPEPTLYEAFYDMISDCVDMAIFLNVNDRDLRIDTAYVELIKCVEQAMDITVSEIREDIVKLFNNAYTLFEKFVIEKERIAAEIACEKRMRKIEKKILRRFCNFKGYESSQIQKSEISSHERYKTPPPSPCICHPQFKYNRYPKDRFGTYLPLKTTFKKVNVTLTPIVSVENLANDPAE